MALKAVNAFRRWVKESLGVVRGEAHLYDARSTKIGLAMVRELSQDDIVQVANGDRPAWFTDEKYGSSSSSPRQSCRRKSWRRRPRLQRQQRIQASACATG